MRLVGSTTLALAVTAAFAACSTARDLEASATSRDCASCHGFPPAQISTSGGAHPSSTSCVVCHSATVDEHDEILAGGAHMNGRVDASAGHGVPFVGHSAAALADLASCRSCHGADYGGGWAPTSCTACHQAPAAEGGASFAGDWTTNCTFCHGGGIAGRDAGWTGDLLAVAPPQAVDGALTGAKVGAHQAHLTAGTYSNPIACTACHGTLPTSLAHVDGVTAVPGYAGGGGSCAVQCHGATSPAWTSTAGIACGACHTTAPTSGLHQYHLVGLGSRSVSCAVCHPGYGPGAVNLATHVDGTFQAFIRANPDGDYPTRERAFSTSTVKQDWGLDSEGCEACHL